MARTFWILLVAVLVSGCGNDPARVPDVVGPEPARGERVIRLDEVGVRFTGPFSWRDLVVGVTGAAGGVQSNRAVLAVWRYERSEPLPRTGAQLEEVRELLVARVKSRDASFVLRDSETARLGGAPAVVLRGRQTIAGLPVEVRSAHVFSAGAEVVLDGYAPPGSFDVVDRDVFRKALATLRLRTPRPKGPGGSVPPVSSATATPSETS